MDENGLDVKVERLAGRIDGLDNRLKVVEAWVPESTKFHVDARRRWDTEDGEQQERNRVSKSRNKWSTLLLLALTTLAAYIAIAVSFHAGWLHFD